MKDERNYSLRAHNTFGIDARCRRFVQFEDAAEARQVAALLRAEGGDYLIIGGGSNLLLTRDYDGTVVRSAVKGMQAEERADGFIVSCGSGERWDDVVAWCAGQGLGALVNLSLIPGDVGASVVQNIGAYGSEVAAFVDTIYAVEIATGQQVAISGADCQYAYRSSRFKHEWRNRYLITGVDYLLPKNAELDIAYGNIRAELDQRGIQHPTAAQLRQVIIDIRRAKLPDPEVEGNAGSFFMNPIVGREVFDRLLAAYPDMPHYYVDEAHEKIPAGWMIDQCGWKGRSLGRAGVHSKQALVLVNRGGATGADIVALCEAVRADVKARFGIDIHPEVNIV